MTDPAILPPPDAGIDAEALCRLHDWRLSTGNDPRLEGAALILDPITDAPFLDSDTDPGIGDAYPLPSKDTLRRLGGVVTLLGDMTVLSSLFPDTHETTDTGVLLDASAVHLTCSETGHVLDPSGNLQDAVIANEQPGFDPGPLHVFYRALEEIDTLVHRGSIHSDRVTEIADIDAAIAELHAAAAAVDSGPQRTVLDLHSNLQRTHHALTLSTFEQGERLTSHLRSVRQSWMLITPKAGPSDAREVHR